MKRRYLIWVVLLVLIAAGNAGEGSRQSPTGNRAATTGFASQEHCPHASAEPDNTRFVYPRVQCGAHQVDWAATARQAEADTMDTRKFPGSRARHRK